MRVSGKILINTAKEKIVSILDDVEKISIIDEEAVSVRVLEKKFHEEIAEFEWRPFGIFPKIKAVFRYDHSSLSGVVWEHRSGLPSVVKNWKLIYTWEEKNGTTLLTRSEYYVPAVPILGELGFLPLWPVVKVHLMKELYSIKKLAEGNGR